MRYSLKKFWNRRKYTYWPITFCQRRIYLFPNWSNISQFYLIWEYFVHDYLLIPYFCQIFTAYSRGLKILVRISRFWLEHFCWSRLLISLKISSYIIFENWKSSLMLIISFIERTLGRFSNFFIAISTGSSNFTVSIR